MLHLGVFMAMKKSVSKPISYFYNPFYKGTSELSYVEVWQVLEDEVLGKLYPWQYTVGASASKRIEALNFIALAQYEKDTAKFPKVKFIYKLSTRLLEENNIQRLRGFVSDGLILCFDIYNLEKMGEKDAMMGLNFLIKAGAHIMIEGIARAPIELLTKYPAEYFLLDYRYYNEGNMGVLAMVKHLADNQGIRLAVCNVNNDTNIKMFTDIGIDVLSGSALVKPRKRLDNIMGVK